jgi:hypothetical protein
MDPQIPYTQIGYGHMRPRARGINLITQTGTSAANTRVVNPNPD